MSLIIALKYFRFVLFFFFLPRNINKATRENTTKMGANLRVFFVVFYACILSSFRFIRLYVISGRKVAYLCFVVFSLRNNNEKTKYGINEPP